MALSVCGDYAKSPVNNKIGDFLITNLRQLCAKLDAYYARLCGHARDERRYTPYGVDPKEVHGEGPSALLKTAFPWRDVPRGEGKLSQAV